MSRVEDMPVWSNEEVDGIFGNGEEKFCQESELEASSEHSL
jgi:hypothetical protein